TEPPRVEDARAESPQPQSPRPENPRPEHNRAEAAPAPRPRPEPRPAVRQAERHERRPRDAERTDDDKPVLAFGDHMPEFLRRPVQLPPALRKKADAA
ncbi:MAG TPA: hypothetical protein VFE11_20555, partial [Dongiaceae bacterium]|nr:hypothetical protein [Dongiaceae bacterium]